MKIIVFNVLKIETIDFIQPGPMDMHCQRKHYENPLSFHITPPL